jgi:Putative peptidoglycan binding domain
MKLHAFCGKAGCKVFTDPGSKSSALGILSAVGADKRCRNNAADVAKVQASLNKFPVAEGGPETKLVEDTVFGPLTAAAIKRFQTKQFGLAQADGVVDVGAQTDKRLAGKASVYSNLTLEMMEKIPLVLNIINRSKMELVHARAYKQGVPDLFGNARKSWNLLNKHFQIEKFGSWQHQLQWINSIYTSMEAAIGYIPQGMFLVADEPLEVSEGAYAFTFPGGFEVSKRNEKWHGISQGTIYLCPRMHNLKPDAFAYCLLHELAHFVGPNYESPAGIIDDHAYRHIGNKYDMILPWQRVHNADCYSQFAFEAVGKTFRMNEHLVDA